MKKLLFLLFAVSFFSAANAQPSAEKAKRVIRGERRDYDPNNADNDARDIITGGNRRTVYNDRNYRSGNNRVDIDRAYNAKIRSIRNNPTLSRAEKNRIIRGLEAERNDRIRETNSVYRNDRRYAEHSSEYDRHYDNKKSKNKYKSNNGKHLGWQKGKGNQSNWN